MDKVSSEFRLQADLDPQDAAYKAELQTQMLIDSFAPEFDAIEIHRIAINASRQTVYESLWTADLGGSAVIKLLMLLRAMPGLLARRHQSSTRKQKVTLHTLINSGFGLLAERASDEVVLGVTGRFWRPTGNLSTFRRSDFDHPVPAGFARGVWNFRVSEGLDGQTILQTETRVICGDTASRQKFLAYWLVVRPFSGLIRLIMLRNVRKAAEKEAEAKSKSGPFVI